MKIYFLTRLLLGSLLILPLPLHAQTAKVMALSSADAKEAADLYAQRDLVNKRIDELQKKIEHSYLMEEKPGPGHSFLTLGSTDNTLSLCSFNSSCPAPTEAEKKSAAKAAEERAAKEKLMHHLERKEGWSSFEFSSDFKFIVPTAPTYASNSTRACISPSWLGVTGN